DLDVLDDLERVEDGVGDPVGELLDEVEGVASDVVAEERVDALVIDGPGEVVVLGGGAEVEVHRDVHLVAPAEAVLLLHHAVVGVEDGVDEADGAEGGVGHRGTGGWSVEDRGWEGVGTGRSDIHILFTLTTQPYPAED